VKEGFGLQWKKKVGNRSWTGLDMVEKGDNWLALAGN